MSSLFPIHLKQFRLFIYCQNWQQTTKQQLLTFKKLKSTNVYSFYSKQDWNYPLKITIRLWPNVLAPCLVQHCPVFRLWSHDHCQCGCKSCVSIFLFALGVVCSSCEFNTEKLQKLQINLQTPERNTFGNNRDIKKLVVLCEIEIGILKKPTVFNVNCGSLTRKMRGSIHSVCKEIM